LSISRSGTDEDLQPNNSLVFALGQADFDGIVAAADSSQRDFELDDSGTDAGHVHHRMPGMTRRLESFRFGLIPNVSILFVIGFSISVDVGLRWL
jgi:hypothetical protein